MAKASKQEEPPFGQIIAPADDPAPPINVEERVGAKLALTPTDRIEARADQLISELKSDELALDAKSQADKVASDAEIVQLREVIGRLKARESSLLNALTALRISYEWAITFNWLSFALIAIGGCVVSYAASLPSPKTPGGIDWRKIVASFAFALLVVGVIVQGFLSHRGARALKGPPVSTNPDRGPFADST